MADTKASAESAAAALDGTEIVRIVQSGSSVRTTVQDIVDLGAFSGALVVKAADQTAANYTSGAMIAWDTETYDVGGWHEGVTNPSRITIPSGVTRVKLTANVVIQSLSGGTYAYLAIYKNGADFPGTGSQLTEATAGTYYLNCSTADGIAVSAGDYFETRLFVETDTSVTVNAAFSSFSVRKVS